MKWTVARIARFIARERIRRDDNYNEYKKEERHKANGMSRVFLWFRDRLPLVVVRRTSAVVSEGDVVGEDAAKIHVLNFRFK